MSNIVLRKPPIDTSHRENGLVLSATHKDSRNSPEEKKMNQFKCVQSIKELIGRNRKNLSNWTLRSIFTVVLISYFCYTIYMGPFLVMLSTLIIQVKCFAEIIDIAYKVYAVKDPKQFKLVSWYFLIAANYFCYGETLSEYFFVFIGKMQALKMLVSCHRFVSFCMYFVGIIWFVLSLRRKHDMDQFSILACTHITLLLIVVQSYMIVKNIFQGLIWLIIPVTSVVCNDIMAYLCGKAFGRTRLIELSPKKSWEGFIGAAILTFVYGILCAYILCNYPFFTCPIEYVEDMGSIRMSLDYEITSTFEMKNYTLHFNVPRFLHSSVSIVACPFIFHAAVFLFFTSIIAPFGGFFASGFKRAFKVKDFGETIPGHGGILDRFDCQFLMATFVNVYITSFVKSSTPEKIFDKVLYLEPERQVQFFNMLKESLKDKLS